MYEIVFDIYSHYLAENVQGVSKIMVCKEIRLYGNNTHNYLPLSTFIFYASYKQMQEGKNEWSNFTGNSFGAEIFII